MKRYQFDFGVPVTTQLGTGAHASIQLSSSETWSEKRGCSL